MVIEHSLDYSCISTAPKEAFRKSTQNYELIIIIQSNLSKFSNNLSTHLFFLEIKKFLLVG